MAVSLAAHVVVLAALALHVPKLMTPPMQSGPPEPIIPVLILPRVPPPHAGGPPTPIRLHRRALRHAPSDLPMPPLIAPEAKADTRREAPSAAARALAPDPAADNARQTLRGLVGCANPANLSREEREKCEQRLARGARDAPFNGLGLDRDDSSEFGRAAARREADYRYSRGEESRAREAGSQLDWDVRRSPPGGVSNMKGMGSSPHDISGSAGRPR
ncbi:hypothetical protein LRS10_14885 [Phenylobacterium sp. J426]|uniref:hypothetical protein n=1 Tax=Phenylobacterium sp. J426 TaxID=2898439 RepID=UPI00215185D2|nr:hypothetical protein [Phenylobacterium sp. J426]MCR5875354.1 hypothetical protein [Phenylobacterium sp. J426]